VVDLPAPFGPNRPKQTPVGTVSDKPSTAAISPKLLRTSVSRIAGSVLFVPLGPGIVVILQGNSRDGDLCEYGRVVPHQDAPQTPDPWQMRASDADRDGYVRHLQDAFAEGRLNHAEYEDRMSAAYEALTYADLYPLLADLPVAADQIPGPPAPQATPSKAVVSTSGGMQRVVQVDEAPALAIFSETRRSGRWVVPQSQNSVAVFGSVTLDLRQAMLQSAEVEIKAVAIFGEVKIKIPADLEVDVNGVGVFGEFARKEKAQDPAPAGAARVKVTGMALFGSVSVTIVPPMLAAPESLASSSEAPNAPALPTGPNVGASSGADTTAADGDQDRNLTRPADPVPPSRHPSGMPPPVGTPIEGMAPTQEPPPLPPEPTPPQLPDPTPSLDGNSGDEQEPNSGR